MAFREMHSHESMPEPRCHDCVCKDENLEKLDKLRSEKDATIEEKSATIRGLIETTKKNAELRKASAIKQKQVANLKVKLQTKDVQPELVLPETNNANTTTEEIIFDLVVKKYKKCRFTAPSMDVLALHM